MTRQLDGYGEEVAIRDNTQKIISIHLRIATSSPVSLTNNVIPSASL
jgi:hypothetical protein